MRRRRTRSRTGSAGPPASTRIPSPPSRSATSQVFDSQRGWLTRSRIMRGSVDRPGLGGGDEMEAPDAGGQDLVAEFEEQAVARGQLGVDGAAAPGAAVDRRGHGGEAFAVEPAAGDAEQPLAQADETIERVARLDDEAIAELQIRLADGPDLLDFAGPRGEGA